MAANEETSGPPPESTSFASSYVCRNGHRTHVRLMLMAAGNAMSEPSWDFCRRCGKRPGGADPIRMPLEIFGMWLRAGMISKKRYADLAHAAAGSV